MTLKETILWITIAIAVDGSLLLFLMYAGFRLLHWGMDYIDLPKAPPPPPRPPVSDFDTSQALDAYGGEVVYLSEEEAKFFLNIDGYKPFGSVN